MATKEQIWTAADEVSAKGEAPTLAAVRAHMGGGSYTDISAAMKDWRASKQAKAAPIREPIPSAIADRLAAFGGELWAAALELANSRLQSEREALEQARQEAEETREEAAALADSLAVELDKAQGELTALSEQLAASLATQKQQQAVIDQFSAAAIENRHRAELAEVAEQACQARLEAAAREIEALKAQLKEERQSAKTSAETAAELKGRLSAIQELKKAEPGEGKPKTEKAPAKARKTAEQ